LASLQYVHIVERLHKDSEMVIYVRFCILILVVVVAVWVMLGNIQMGWFLGSIAVDVDGHRHLFLWFNYAGSLVKVVATESGKTCYKQEDIVL